MAETTSENQDASRTNFVREQIEQDLAAGTHDGQVVTRFPPEPNGYLHIGHSKAVCLNFGTADDFDGVCNLRFDDTNPEAEDEEFVNAIVDDIRWLGFEPGDRIFYASDYYQRLYDWAEELIGKGLAYVDDQTAEEISNGRGDFSTPGVASPFRDRTPEENLGLFRRMRDGEFDEGTKVLRAKIDMANRNMQMRDPIMYRIRHTEHYRTGSQWSIYPTYDWAHGQSDAIEGVTHSLCTLEFQNNRELYDWYLDHLDLDRVAPRQYEFARLELTHTVTSKRLLRSLVNDGVVEGWDDAVMPTLRGVRRRGYPPAAIRKFCEHIGVAKTNSTVDIELLESFVRTELNAVSARRMAVLKPLRLVIENWPEDHVELREAVNNPEDPSAGTRKVAFSGELFIEQDDFMIDPPKKYYRLTVGREVRLRYGYFVTCTGYETDDDGNVTTVRATYDPATAGGEAPDGRKVKSTIHWVSAAHAAEAEVMLYERLFTDPHPGAEGADPLASLNPAVKERLTGARVEAAVLDTPPGDVIQFERLGYFAHDLDRPGLFHRTVGLRDDWKKIQARAAKS